MSARANKNRMGLTALICVAVVVGMTGLAFAAPPLYRAFCQLTGYGGTTQLASTGPSAIIERQIEVRFDTNVASDLPISFEPVQRSETLRLGETGLAYFRIRNPTDEPITAVATFNVAPYKTGVYFQKLACFCFQDTTIPAHADVELPVVFFVDPELASNPDTEEVTQITLSYTYFRSLEEAGAALAASAR